MKKTNLCDGCKTFSTCFFNYQNQYQLDTCNCPCQTCLVKKVCVEMCEEYEIHYDAQKKIMDELPKNDKYHILYY
mgnify:CR=1 FL=1